MASDTSPHTNEDLPAHRLVVMLFTEVRAVDRLDASHIAEGAVRSALRPFAPEDRRFWVLPFSRPPHRDELRGWEVPVRVSEIRVLGLTCGDGYLFLEPTAKAYRT